MTSDDLSESSVRFSLFRFAPRELSHSAFWAWALQNAEPGDSADPEVGALGRALLRSIEAPEPNNTMKVQTERVIPGRRRLDIWAKIDGVYTVIIETKVAALPGQDQLRAYEKVAGHPRSLVLLSTAYHPAFGQEQAGEWQYLNEEHLGRVIDAVGSGHPTICDYRSWLADLIDNRARRHNNALSDNLQTCRDALEFAEGQWEFLSTLVEGMPQSACALQSRGGNPDGSSWTQWRFALRDSESESLFYRLDKAKHGPYVSLRQYQKPPSPDWEAKRQRRDTLRQLWKDAVADVQPGLKFRPPRNKGRNESEIAWLYLEDNTPQMVRSKLPLVHAAFLEALEGTDWQS